MNDWTTPADLRAQLEKSWQRGELLRARVDDTPLYPLTLRLKMPSARQLTEDFAAVADWVSTLRRGSKAQQGQGYTLHWRRWQHRVHGANDLPHAVTVDSEADALALIGKRTQAERFSGLAVQLLSRFPELRGWLGKRPLRLLQHESDWPLLLAVLETFRARPRPGCYLRELDIPGVHSKFVEQHRGLLAELLDLVLPEQAIDWQATGARGFNRRYGLRDKPSRIRFRFLDHHQAPQGLTDLEIPVEDFARLSPAVDTVFITENDINGLAFPAFPRALVIFGLGYGVERLARIDWLAHCRVHYWGDIDTHGFAILHRLRRHLPGAASLLMDIATLEAHQDMWGAEQAEKRFLGELPLLSPPEQALYRQLCEDRLAPCLRLEQEHVSQRWLRERLPARIQSGTQ